MKTISKILIILPLLHAFCCSSKDTHTHENKKHIHKIVIDQVDFDIMTFADISCNDFENAFTNMKKQTIITNPKEILLLENYIENLVLVDSSHRKAVDTRAKIFLISHTDTTELCMDRFVTFHNDNYHKTSSKLRSYIENLDN